jgi:hypothetical protein
VTRNRHNILLVGALVFAAAWGACAASAQEAVPKHSDVRAIRVARETTFIIEPLDRNGYVDYPAAINAEASHGVTPANNFEVVVRRVCGVSAIDETVRPEYFRRLGIAPPQRSQSSFRNFKDYARAVAERATSDRDVVANRVQNALQSYWKSTAHPWSAKDYPQVAAWLSENASNLDRIAKGAQLPAGYTPYVARAGKEGSGVPMLDIDAPFGEERRGLGFSLLARAMQRLGTGGAAGARSELLAAHRIARHTAQGALLNEALAGRAIEDAACRADCELLAPGRLDLKATQAYASALQQLGPLEPVAPRIDHYARFLYLDAVTCLARQTARPNSVRPGGGLGKLLDGVNAWRRIDWNQVLKWGNPQFDQMVRIAQIRNTTERHRASGAMLKEFEDRVKSLKENPIKLLLHGVTGAVEDILYAEFAIDPARLGDAEERGEAWSRLVQLAFAAAAFRNEHGRLPPKLADLAPRYMHEIPLDPFVDRPFLYRLDQNGAAIYSVGPNGKDDGGVVSEEDEVVPEGDDIVVRLAR